MAGRHKEVSDEVHQNQILRELYLKELRTQKLYTQYHVNPLRKGERAPRGGERGEGAGQGEAELGSSSGDVFSDLAPLPRLQEL